MPGEAAPAGVAAPLAHRAATLRRRRCRRGGTDQHRAVHPDTAWQRRATRRWCWRRRRSVCPFASASAQPAATRWSTGRLDCTRLRGSRPNALCATGTSWMNTVPLCNAVRHPGNWRGGRRDDRPPRAPPLRGPSCRAARNPSCGSTNAPLAGAPSPRAAALLLARNGGSRGPLRHSRRRLSAAEPAVLSGRGPRTRRRPRERRCGHPR